MANWEELNFRERELQEQEERIMAETRQVESVTEYYQNFSQQEQRFFYDLSEKSYHTESTLYWLGCFRYDKFFHSSHRNNVVLGVKNFDNTQSLIQLAEFPP